MHVIGTAGHIDHGKSTLIRALTGIDPDRLPEEKARGMTIDLGFAWVTLPSGREAGIVDVPGHQRFVKNMLAGVTGIDLTLFVVAATEGWMPQSQEHFDILNLLSVDRMIVVLTKADLVDDEWLDLVREDVGERLAGTRFEAAPMVAVSAVSGQGMDKLRTLIDEELAKVPPRPDLGRARLWIDRAFSVRGAGTVVTGTLTGGSLAVDQDVEILPRGLAARVRGLQTHRRQVERAVPGSRVAVNLSGVERTDVERGCLLAQPGLWKPTSLVRAFIRLLPSSPRTLPKISEVKVYLGSAERVGRLRLVDADALGPGEDALADISLDEAVAVEIGDPLVLREPGLHATLGGGSVLDASPQPLRRRPRPHPASALPGVLARRLPAAGLAEIRARAAASPEELPLLVLKERGAMALDALRREMPLSAEQVERVLRQGEQEGAVVRLPSYVWSAPAWEVWQAAVVEALREFHARFPLRVGEDRETLRSRLGAQPKLFDESLQRWAQEGLVQTAGAHVALVGHRVQYTREQEEELERLWRLLEDSGYEPPTLDDLLQIHGFDRELLGSLMDEGRLVPVGKGFLYPRETLDRIAGMIVNHLARHGEMDVSQLRDALSTSRKYAVPLMEHFDQVGLTRRVGDKRILARGAAQRREA